MIKASREFQVFVKPAGAVCNLGCRYCYYLDKERLYPNGASFPMPDDLLEEYIVQHIDACTEPEIRFSWHGGEPTILGLDYFRNIVNLQRKHRPSHRRISNGMQTNGTLLNEDWCRFLADEEFVVGLSLDGPADMHDRYRLTKDQKATHAQTMRGYELLQKHRIECDILCVVNAWNARHPTKVYRFFKQIEAGYISFLPMVERQPQAETGVSDHTVTPEAWGEFLCTIFDEWVNQDIGRLKIQIFEEAARVAFAQEHSLCIFRPVCGNIPVVEHNGDFYSCDHFVDAEHHLSNIRETPLVELLESPAQMAFGQAKWETLPLTCRECEVRDMCHGECPKNRFVRAENGEPGLNYLCEGYKRFFTHCLPWVADVAVAWRRQAKKQQIPQEPIPGSRPLTRPDRNDPCPCGSGLKFKKCCLGK